MKAFKKYQPRTLKMFYPKLCRAGCSAIQAISISMVKSVTRYKGKTKADITVVKWKSAEPKVFSFVSVTYPLT